MPPTLAARNATVAANLGLVGGVVRSVRRRDRRARSVPFDDLFQSGCIGLIRAAELYDPGRKVPFAGYAGPWIRATIGDALREWHLVAPSKWAHDRATKWRRMAVAGVDGPEIARRLGLKPSGVAMVRRALEAEGGTAFGLGEVWSHAGSEDDPADVAEATERRELVREGLAQLPPIEGLAVRLRFGIGDGGIGDGGPGDAVGLAAIRRITGLGRDAVRAAARRVAEMACGGEV